ncbi:lysine--tRNA ligase [Salarchaeum sp. III]|uniref:lysine--tRNA ligase n=1 Tax=Salarchaeum sp. III TaxID=3107927 RepID=UPI002ED92354
MSSPHVLSDAEYVFWADEIADRIEARNPEDPVVIKGGISPSGVPHLGNMNELARGYFVAAVLRERGHEVQQIFTSDDRDPLRKLPRKLADLDGRIVDLGDVNAGALGKNLGHPYTSIPDPFGCCDSYGAHFSSLIEDSAELMGIPVEMVSNTELYESGELEDATRHVLANADLARDVLGKYQDKVDESYVPFNPICEECGKVTETVLEIDADGGTVEYECTDLDAGDRTIEGCGHRGTASLRDGKLPWRFEWPAQWRVLGVDFEPFGKDHAEGSWPSGVDIMETVFEDEPPVPMVYEWFTLNGEPFSSSEGNVILVSDVLDLVERDVLRYFFTKEPKKARDFSTDRIDLLVDEFDRFERIYFGEVEDASADERELAERVYPLVVDEVREERIRIPYTFAAVLGMTDDPELREEIARREGHIPDNAPDWAVEEALARVDLAREWAERTDNEYNYRINRERLPDVDLDSETEAALDELADFVAEGHDGEEVQGEIYETAKRHDIDIGEFFSVGYRLFFEEEEGPKLGQFLAALDEDFVVARLRRER